MFCNACGKELKSYGQNGMLAEDVFSAEKEWGYFSNKDMMRHSFLLCEACYDEMVSKFVIPPKEEEIVEL